MLTKSAVRVLVLSGLVTGLWLSAAPGSNADTPKNLFANPSFEEGRELWGLEKTEGTKAEFTVDDRDAAAGRHSALIKTGTVREWGVQFGQTMDAPAVGKRFTFAVVAKSVQAPVKVKLEIERTATPYDRAAETEELTLTPDAWKEFHVTFQVAKPFRQGWFAYLSCAQPNAEFRLDMFRLYEGAYVPYRDAARDEQATAAVSLFDTGSGSPVALDSDTILRRTGWTQVAEDETKHTFRGDAVLLNDRLVVVLRHGGSGAEVHSRRTSGIPLRTILAPAGEPADLALASLAIVENTPVEVVMDAEFQSANGKRQALRFALVMGQMFVKTTPRQGTTALRITAPCRFAVLPDFFADDIVVDAMQIPVAKAELPSENFLLQLLPGGDAIVMSVASQRNRDAEIGVASHGSQRMIDHSTIDYGTGGTVWVAVLEAPGVWHQHNVAGDDANKIIPLGWRPPFPAQWRVDWKRSDDLTDSWEMIAQKGDGHFEKYGWADDADTIPRNRKRWTTVLGNFSYPCWLDQAGLGYLQPLKHEAVRFLGPAVIYPIKRVRTTPLEEFTIVDLVRGTLGVGPCEYILDVEGQGSHYNGRATCATRDDLAAIYRHRQQKTKKAEIEQILQEVVVFVKHIRGRIEDYVQFGHELLGYLDQQAKAHPELRERIAELRSIVRKIDAHVDGRKADIKTPQYVIDLTEKFRRTVMDYEGDDALSKCNAITHAIVDVGGNQDELAGECRMVVKALRQRAGLLMAFDPRAADMAREIRQRCQKVLRNPAVHEGARH